MTILTNKMRAHNVPSNTRSGSFCLGHWNTNSLRPELLRKKSNYLYTAMLWGSPSHLRKPHVALVNKSQLSSAVKLSQLRYVNKKTIDGSNHKPLHFPS